MGVCTCEMWSVCTLSTSTDKVVSEGKKACFTEKMFYRNLIETLQIPVFSLRTVLSRHKTQQQKLFFKHYVHDIAT